ncbi:Uncharacterized protein SCF082_LOCUS51860 [Durusdinium trenchii]|uniref:Uncharacterized protein n=1 Tax=Durusdinium trenchii TaxID=1381693 RepID=A0ABP0SHD5_9DINO
MPGISQVERTPLNLSEAHFHCATAPPVSHDKCFSKHQSVCRSGEWCFMKDNQSRGVSYGACCCNQIELLYEIEHRRDKWSCFIQHAQTDGWAPFCDIRCCRRPFVSRACHGNPAICCNGEEQICGITLEGQQCCADKFHRKAGASCCRNLGTTCWHSPAALPWMVVPVFKGRPCCLEDLPEVMCVSQETCDQNFAAAVGWSAAGVLLAAGLLCRFYFKRSGTDISSGRCCSWCMKMLSPVVGLFVALLLVAYFSFQHIWQDVTPAAAREVCAWWAAWGLMLMLAAVCLFLCGWRLYHSRSRTQPSPRPGFGGRNLSIAVPINIEDYLNQTTWPRVYDRFWRELVTWLEEMGWKVLPWHNLKKDDVEAMLHQIQQFLGGAVRSTIFLYISCHSQTNFGSPQFLPADARRWGDGVSIFTLVKRLSNIAGCRHAKIHVMMNGCLQISERLDRLIWVWRYELGQSPDAFRLSSGDRLLRNSEAQAWILFACHPGRRVPGDEITGGVFTKKVLRVLRDNLKHGDSRIECYYEELVDVLRTSEDGVRFHPYLVTTGNNNEGSRRPSMETNASSTTAGTMSSSGVFLSEDPEADESQPS